MSKQFLKRKVFLLAIRTPVVTVLIIVFTFVSLFVITFSSYTNVYTKFNAEINYRGEREKTFIQLYIDKKDVGQAKINSYSLWYLEQEGKWYKAPIVEFKDIPERNSFYLRIKPVQEEVQKEFLNRPKGIYSVNVEILTGKEKIISKLFGGEAEVSQ